MFSLFWTKFIMESSTSTSRLQPWFLLSVFWIRNIPSREIKLVTEGFILLESSLPGPRTLLVSDSVRVIHISPIDVSSAATGCQYTW